MPEEVYVPAKYRREGLTPRNFACIIAEDGRKVAKYPLNTKKRVRNAMARYNQEATAKCKGGMKKICAAHERKGMTGTPAFKEHCK